MATTRLTECMGNDLVAMAGDPDIQRELRQIEAEFACIEADELILDWRLINALEISD